MVASSGCPAEVAEVQLGQVDARCRTVHLIGLRGSRSRWWTGRVRQVQARHVEVEKSMPDRSIRKARQVHSVSYRGRFKAAESLDSSTVEEEDMSKPLTGSVVSLPVL